MGNDDSWTKGEMKVEEVGMSSKFVFSSLMRGDFNNDSSIIGKVGEEIFFDVETEEERERRFVEIRVEEDILLLSDRHSIRSRSFVSDCVWYFSSLKMLVE